jgi:hypothetical protein
MFIPGNTLTARARGKKHDGKLLLVEEWSYVHNDEFGLFYKKEAIFDQGNALNYRGIPWVSYLPHPSTPTHTKDNNSYTPISQPSTKEDPRASTPSAPPTLPGQLSKMC